MQKNLEIYEKIPKKAKKQPENTKIFKKIQNKTKKHRYPIYKEVQKYTKIHEEAKKN